MRFFNTPLLLFFLGLIAGVFSSILVYSLTSDIIFNHTDSSLRTENNYGKPINAKALKSVTDYHKSQPPITSDAQKTFEEATENNYGKPINAKALKSVTDYHKSQPPITSDAQKTFEEANVFLNKKKCDKALPLYLELKKKWPRALGLLNNIAICYTQQRKLEKARILLEQAINYHKGLKITHNNLTRLYSRLSKLAYQKVQIGIDIRNSPSEREIRQSKSILNHKTPLELTALKSFFGLSLANTPPLALAKTTTNNTATISRPDSNPSASISNLKSSDKTPSSADKASDLSTSAKKPPMTVASATTAVTTHTVTLPQPLLVSQQQMPSKKAISAKPTKKPPPSPKKSKKSDAPDTDQKSILEIIKQPKVVKQERVIKKSSVPLSASSSASSAPSDPSLVKKKPSTSPSNKKGTPKNQLKNIQREVANWAKAWSAQNLDMYFSHYSNRFQPKTLNIEQWREERTAKISNKKKIRIDISHLKIKISPSGKKAEAIFLQTYRSSTFRLRTQKRLAFILENGHWRIVTENSM